MVVRSLLLPLGIRDNLGYRRSGYQLAARHPADIHSFYMLACWTADHFIAGHVHSYTAGIYQPIIGQCCDICTLTAFVLADRPVVFCAAWDLCPQTKCVLFSPHQFEIGAFHIPNQWNVRDQRADPITGVELFMEGSSQ